jgi:hypothetical protein
VSTTTERIMKHNRHATALVMATVRGDDAEARRLLDDPSADPGVDALLSDILRDARQPEEPQDPERFDGRDCNDVNWRP